MKTLYLVRHAKSSWEENVTDALRPLNKRGVSDSQLMAEYTASAFVRPELILSSTAVRAYTTAQTFQKAYGLADIQMDSVDKLYDFSGDNVLNVIQQLPENIKIVMIFGHNHGLTHLVNKLGNKYVNHLPTCGLVQITFQASTWNNLNKGKTTAVVFPKDLKQ